MDWATILVFLTENPLCLFVLGVAVGYLLRLFISEQKGKRRGRYQTIKADFSPKRAALTDDEQGPAFDLPDSVLKTLTPSRYGNIAIDQNANEWQ